VLGKLQPFVFFPFRKNFPKSLSSSERFEAGIALVPKKFMSRIVISLHAGRALLPFLCPPSSDIPFLEAHLRFGPFVRVNFQVPHQPTDTDDHKIHSSGAIFFSSQFLRF